MRSFTAQEGWVIGYMQFSGREKVNGGWLVLIINSKLLSFANAPQIIGRAKQNGAASKCHP
jgi:hypothetical protein